MAYIIINQVQNLKVLYETFIPIPWNEHSKYELWIKLDLFIYITYILLIHLLFNVSYIKVSSAHC